ncbi:MAG TPA: hypothetical protein VGR47_08715 [Terracidiphilus sp.]|nr:hypothetical protein [Terracidiphilus sp.]
MIVSSEERSIENALSSLRCYQPPTVAASHSFALFRFATFDRDLACHIPPSIAHITPSGYVPTDGFVAARQLSLQTVASDNPLAMQASFIGALSGRGRIRYCSPDCRDGLPAQRKPEKMAVGIAVKLSSIRERAIAHKRHFQQHHCRKNALRVYLLITILRVSY